MLRWLAAQGFRPLLMDWGAPGPARGGVRPRRLRRASGCCRRSRAARAARRAARCRWSATAWAARSRSGSRRGAPDDVAGAGHHRRALGLRLDPRRRRRLPRDAPRRAASPAPSALLDGLGEAFGMVPVSVFQMLFALVNPMQAALKFQKLARLDPDGPAARLFVALEDWLADGVPMPAGAAQRPAGRLADPQPDRRPAAGASSAAPVDPRRDHARPALVVLRRRATPSRRRRSPQPLGRRAPAAPRTLAAAHRPRRHGRRQRRARRRSGGRSRSSSPAMPVGRRGHPVEPPRPMCEEGWPDAPGGDSSVGSGATTGAGSAA